MSQGSGQRLDTFLRSLTAAAAVAVPIVIAVIGANINESIANAQLRAEYVNIAVDVLAAEKPANDDGSARDADLALRRWAVDVLELNSPVTLDAQLTRALSQGDVTLTPTVYDSFLEGLIYSTDTIPLLEYPYGTVPPGD